MWGRWVHGATFSYRDSAGQETNVDYRLISAYLFSVLDHMMVSSRVLMTPSFPPSPFPLVELAVSLLSVEGV